MTEDGVLLSTVEEGIVMVEVHRPAKLNALRAEDFPEISRIFREIELDSSIRAVIVTGAGRGFCAGIDLDDEAAISRFSTNRYLETQSTWGTFPLEMRRCRKPIIAAVNGPAAGGGFALSLAADIRIASTQALFKASFIKIGVTGGDLGLSYSLPRIVGLGIATEMALTGRSVLADEALRIGLVSRVVEPGELMAAALETARSITANTPLGVRLTKQVLHTNVDAPSLEAAMELEHRNQAIAGGNADMAEALSAFREGRKPHFTDQ